MKVAADGSLESPGVFPKTQSGADPMTNAPTPVADKQLNELGIRVLPKLD